MSKTKLPGFDRYYMDIAISVSKRANCLGKKVGAIIVVDNRIVATGYNGVPEGMVNCLDGGCIVCVGKKKKRDKKKTKEKRNGKKYDDCICVHAEQNALMTAARIGIPIEGGTVYSVYRPCFGCTKQMLQAKIMKVVFKENWVPSDRRLIQPYEKIQDRFRDGIWEFKSGDKFEILSNKKNIPGA